jgi:DNA (cytosine-5)-methyltransferase 1
MIPVYGGSDPECADTVTRKWAKGSGGPSGNECGLFVAQPIPIHDQATRHAGKHGDKQDGKGNGLGIGQPGDPMNTLTKGDRHAVAQPIAFSGQMSNPQVDFDMTSTLGAKNPMAVAQPIGFTRCDYGGDAVMDGTPTMRCGSNYSAHLAAAIPNMAVRRLTPTECEALQGFPKNYTNIPWRKKEESPDGPRYKALGNSMAVPVMAWIGKRIANAP